MNRFYFVVFASILTFGGIARAQDLRLGTINLAGRGLLSVFVVPKGDERCVLEIRNPTGSRVQQLEPEDPDCKEQLRLAETFATMDMNFDGFADFGFTRFCGNRNCSCSWYLYSPASRQFQASPALADVPCEVQLDRRAKTLTFSSRGSINSMHVDMYQWKDAELFLVRQEVNLMAGPEPEAKVCAITQIVSELKKAGMVEVSRTCTMNGEPCSCDEAKAFF